MAGFFLSAKRPCDGKGLALLTTNTLERVIAPYGNGPRFIARRSFDMIPKVEPNDPRLVAMPDVHGHAKGEHKPFSEERPIPYTARMLFLWFYHAARRGAPRFMMVADHVNFLTFEDPAAVNLVRRALKLAAAGDLYGAAESAGVEVGHAAVVSEGLRQGMRFVIGAELDNDPRSRPDAQNIVDAMKPDGLVRSVHFLTIDHPEHGAGWQWPFDNAEFAAIYESLGTARVWELYESTLLEALEKQPGHIVGHIYVAAKFGHWPEPAALEAFEDRLLAACAEHGMAIEVNTRYLYNNPDSPESQERYLAAYRRLLRKAQERGVPVAVASDAHSPKDQGGAFDVALALLDEAEINELAFPIGGRIARVALRAPREEPPPPEPEPEVAEVVAAAAPARSAPKRAAASRRPARQTSAEDDAERVPSETLAAASEPAVKARPSRARSKEQPKLESLADVAESAGSSGEAPAKPAAKPSKAPDLKPVPAAQGDARKTPQAKPAPVKAAPAKVAAKVAPAKAASAKAIPSKASATKPAAAKPLPARAATAKTVATKALPKAASAKTAAGKTAATKTSTVPSRAATGKTAAAKGAPPKKVTAGKVSLAKSAAKTKVAKTPAGAKKAAPPARKPASKAVAAKKKTTKPAKRPVAKRAATARKPIAKKAPAKKKPSRSRR